MNIERPHQSYVGAWDLFFRHCARTRTTEILADTDLWLTRVKFEKWLREEFGEDELLDGLRKFDFQHKQHFHQGTA